MTYRVDSHSDTPPSKQLVAAVLNAIARNELAAGDRLPSVRRMATLALVNPNTVAKAYKELEIMGVARGINGSGVFVTEHGPSIAMQDRRSSSLEQLKRVLEDCLRAGHDPATIKLELERCLAASTAKGKKTG
ncbi:MAG: GntR family transcriptional regulator [Planctomycetota bacterium]